MKSIENNRKLQAPGILGKSGASVIKVMTVMLSLLTVSTLDAGLLSSWEFNPDNISGSSVAATGGTATNTTGTLQADAAVVNGALSLDGVGDYLQFGNNVSDLKGLAQMTISAWVRSTSAHGPLGQQVYRRIVEHEDHYYLWAHDSSEFAFTVHGSNPAEFGGYADVDRWQHVVATYESGVPAALYIDGVLDATDVPTNGQAVMPNNSDALSIGARRHSSSWTASHFWHGLIDDVAIWDNVLPESEIRDLAGYGRGGYDGRTTPTGEVNVVPEPAAILLAIMGLALLPRRRRKAGATLLMRQEPRRDVLGKSGASVIKVMAVMAIVMLGNVRVTKATNFEYDHASGPLNYKVIMAPDNFPAFSELAEVANANAFTVNKWLNVYGHHAYDFSAGDMMTVFYRNSGEVTPINLEYIEGTQNSFNSAPGPWPQYGTTGGRTFGLGAWGDRLTEQTWNAEMMGNPVGDPVSPYPNGFDPTDDYYPGWQNADYHNFTDGTYAYNGSTYNHVFASLVAVPEPAAMLLALFGLALLPRRRRR